jgi:hypothetical protein
VDGLVNCQFRLILARQRLAPATSLRHSHFLCCSAVPLRPSLTPSEGPKPSAPLGAKASCARHGPHGL